jgi:hypothetical protein
MGVAKGVGPEVAGPNFWWVARSARVRVIREMLPHRRLVVTNRLTHVGNSSFVMEHGFFDVCPETGARTLVAEAAGAGASSLRLFFFLLLFSPLPSSSYHFLPLLSSSLLGFSSFLLYITFTYLSCLLFSFVVEVSGAQILQHFNFPCICIKWPCICLPCLAFACLAPP